MRVSLTRISVLASDGIVGWSREGAGGPVADRIGHARRAGLGVLDPQLQHGRIDVDRAVGAVHLHEVRARGQAAGRDRLVPVVGVVRRRDQLERRIEGVEAHVVVERRGGHARAVRVGDRDERRVVADAGERGTPRRVRRLDPTARRRGRRRGSTGSRISDSPSSSSSSNTSRSVGDVMYVRYIVSSSAGVV